MNTTAPATKICPVILAGGTGNRLWPLSTPEFPKQFLELFNQPSLLAQVLQRINNQHFLPPVIVCNQQHSELVSNTLVIQHIEHATILEEPKSQNTALAIALACSWAHKHLSTDTTLLILPADQTIDPVQNWQQAIVKTLPEAQKGQLCLFGIEPAEPSPQLGYILTNENHPQQISHFVEKPTTEKAKELMNTKRAYWNSGMFMAKLSAIEKWIYIKHKNLANQPFDKAVVEPLCKTDPNSLHITPLDCHWQDLGTWETIYDASAKSNLPTFQRHWGHYTILHQRPGCKLKLLHINPGASISLQRHEHRTEHWVVIGGIAEVLLGEDLHLLERFNIAAKKRQTAEIVQIEVQSDSNHITVPSGFIHKLTNHGTSPLRLLETQTGSYLEEDDIERF